MNETNATPKLSKTQKDTLKRLATNGRGWEPVPGGYSGAGRDAARWYRTMQVLARHGLVARPKSKKSGETLYGVGYELTDAGRELAKNLA